MREQQFHLFSSQMSFAFLSNISYIVQAIDEAIKIRVWLGSFQSNSADDLKTNKIKFNEVKYKILHLSFKKAKDLPKYKMGKTHINSHLWGKNLGILADYNNMRHEYDVASNKANTSLR